MPVPVPPISKPVAHPVHKHYPSAANITYTAQQQFDPKFDSFYHLSQTLPASPVGPPAAFGTREEWINSLPVWRREKPRRSWDDTDDSDYSEVQGFSRGLISAEDALVIKGEYAEACIPPRLLLKTHLTSSGGVSADPPHSSDADADDEMSPEDSALDNFALDNASQWSATSPAANGGANMQIGADSFDRRQQPSCTANSSVAPAFGAHAYDHAQFTPAFEDDSSGNVSGQDVGSSPLGPVTPFGEFIDRAVTSQTYVARDNLYRNAVPVQAYSHQDAPRPYNVYHQLPAQQVQEQCKQPPATDVVTPSANANYWRLAEPLSEWLANYVWKVCTAGFGLPDSSFRPAVNTNLYQSFPPSQLPSSVHKLLLATLLQPSAVVLSLWYIAKLPALFDLLEFSQAHVKELAFREVWLAGCDRDGVDNAPFRLVVLGCILANKWLDDHTFSNKTWHTITGISVATLNKLELLALEIFDHNLSISDRDWSQWLDHIMSYHMSLVSPIQPISRPSANPHALIRRAFEEIIQAPVACRSVDSPISHPVFLGLEERKRELIEKERHALEVSEINLDEDGPLREEYVPKRRTSGAVAVQDKRWTFHGDNGWEILRNANGPLKDLPPPAKWSPAGDEPILRDAPHKSGHYVAVQPPMMAPPLGNGTYAIHPQHHQTHSLDVAMSNPWHCGASRALALHNAGDIPPMKQLPPPPGYPFEYPPHYLSGPPNATFNPGPGIYHSRAQSYGHEQVQLPRHSRSFSTTAPFDYQRNEFQLAPNEHYPVHLAPNLPHFTSFPQVPHLVHQPEIEAHWAPPPPLSNFMYPGHHNFVLGVGHPQTTWLQV